MRRHFRRPSPTLVIACLALLFALSGTSVASVAQLTRNSVGAPQLKRNAVTAQKVAPNAIRTGHVLDGSLLTADFKAGQIPQGPKGDKGDTGSAGPPGISGYQIVTSAMTSNSITFFGGRAATCPSGKRVIGGGASALAGNSVTPGYRVIQHGPVGDNAWRAIFDISNPGGVTTFEVVTYAICANVTT